MAKIEVSKQRNVEIEQLNLRSIKRRSIVEFVVPVEEKIEIDVRHVLRC